MEALFNLCTPGASLIKLADEQGEMWFRPIGDECALVRVEGDRRQLTGSDSIGSLPVTTINNCLLADKCPSLESVKLRDGVIMIGNRAFKDCEKLTEINLPQRLERIGEGAFSGCESIVEFSFPESLRSIGFRALSSCYKLESLHLNEGPETVGGDPTYFCRALTEITIPSTLRVLPRSFAYGSSPLRSIIVPEGVTTLEDFALDCKDMICAFIPASVETLEYSAVDINTIVYAPEGSAAAQWALETGREYIPCERAEDMPTTPSEQDDDFSTL